MDIHSLLNSLDDTGFNLKTAPPIKDGKEPGFPYNISTYTTEQLREYLTEVTAWIGFLDTQLVISNIEVYETKAAMEATLAKAFKVSPSKAKAEQDEEFVKAKIAYYKAKAYHESFKIRIDRLSKFAEATKQLLISSMQERKYNADPDVGP
jgi:hypothetical protein